MNASEPITVKTFVNAPASTVWSAWNEPRHIINWYFASDDWHAPHAENDLTKDGNLKIRMEAKDGSSGFDFTGTYEEIEPRKFIAYKIADGRKVSVKFEDTGEGVNVTETFEAENVHSRELQQSGWQAILDNFKSYTESLVSNSDKS